jgi:hypothetical protein
MIKIACLTLCFLLFQGCAVIKPVKPWQKGILAKDIMKPDNGNSMITKFSKHVFFSKEASKGGGGVAGGGCGCN